MPALPVLVHAARPKPRTLASATVSLLSRQASSSSGAAAYDGHIPLNWFENAFLAVGSGIVLLTNPNRAGKLGSQPVSFLLLLTRNIIFVHLASVLS